MHLGESASQGWYAIPSVLTLLLSLLLMQSSKLIIYILKQNGQNAASSRSFSERTTQILMQGTHFSYSFMPSLQLVFFNILSFMPSLQLVFFNIFFKIIKLNPEIIFKPTFSPILPICRNHATTSNILSWQGAILYGRGHCDLLHTTTPLAAVWQFGFRHWQ